MTNKLKEKFKNKKVILASGSLRRQELLKGLDIPFIIETRDVNEVYPLQLEAGEITEYLARLKAGAFSKVNFDVIVITADTIVWLDKKAVMKPRNKDEAIEILGKLSNKCHQVYTSVCLKSNDKEVVFTDVTKVYFNEIAEFDIEYYVNKYKPYDKAGGYGVQEWIGYIAIKKIEGSYYNVMGLPVHKLYKELLKF